MPPSPSISLARAPHGDFDAWDALSTAIILISPSTFVITTSNLAAQSMLGMTSRSLSGRQVADLPTPFAHVLPPLVQRCCELEQAITQLSTHGDFSLLVLVTPMESARGGGVLIEMTPLTQASRAERDQHLEQLSQAHWQMSRQLAHEIKNPLGGIRGAAQLLSYELPSDGLREYTQVIIQEADRLQQLVDRMLGHVAPVQHKERVNIHAVCERVRKIVSAEFPDRLRLRADYDISIPEFDGYESRLIQALLNVVRNAAQALLPQQQPSQDSAMPTIVIRTRVERGVLLQHRTARLALKLQVIDTGPGIPGDLQTSIFLPLVTGRPGGHGLGLTVAQEIASEHGGMLDFVSRPGYTEFYFLLPLESYEPTNHTH